MEKCLICKEESPKFEMSTFRKNPTQNKPDGLLCADCRQLPLKSFDETTRLKTENEKLQETLMKIKGAYESKDENALDELLYKLFTNEIYDDSY